MSLKISFSLNGEKKTLNCTHQLNTILQACGFSSNNYAVAINGEFIPRSTYEKITLIENDKLDIVSPITGG
jgi:sulfur carrier protein